MKKKIKFTPAESHFDFSRQEKLTLKWWYQSGLINNYLSQNNQSPQSFSFIDGPITANGPMGVHHARGRTLKDLFQRYKNLQGYKQRFQNGFDCQGLWVEVEVEKEAGFNSKKDIINYGLEKFTQNCLTRVKKYSGIQTEQSKRLGMFMDWKNSYYTNSLINNLYIWYFLNKVHQKGWLYQQKSSSTWCPRCETGLSQHEQADGYKTISENSLYLKFKIKNRKNHFLLAWTTTPWTLAANILLAINRLHQYVRVEDNNNFLYLARDSALRLGFKQMVPIDPQELLALEYESVFKIPAQEKIKHFVVDWDLVDPREGTGIVHVAPGCGQEDYELGKKLKCDLLSPLDETGHFISGYGDLSGLYAHSVAPRIIEYLQKQNSLFKTEITTHRYPHCWRCKTKCLFRLEDNWFISTKAVKDYLKKAALSVNWMPKYAGRRMQNWLDNMEDWMISRKRFYGLSLPFYPCPRCSKLTVVASLEELKRLAVDPSLVDQLPSLHRPWIDKITIKCPNCNQIVNRITDVGDCWLDAGAVPFSTLKYLEDKDYWLSWFPAEFICEMTEQVRLWYYSMLFFSVTLEDRTPYLNVLNYSEVRDEKGERMSKTKLNGIPFDQAVETMTADAMRWLYCRQKSHQTVNFGYHIADELKRNFILIFWNSYRYFVTQANINNWSPDKLLSQPITSDLIDRWLISRLNQLINEVGQSLDKYNTPASVIKLEEFVNDLSTWYIRRSRDRQSSLPVLYFALEHLVILLAPFIPFLSEYIYQQLTGSNYLDPQNSVHLEKWPKPDNQFIDSGLDQNMELTREISRLIHAQRQIAAIKIRQPLALATVISPQASLQVDFLALIKEETNLKELKWINQKGSALSVSLDTALTPQLIVEGNYRDLIRSIQILRKELRLNLKDKIKIYAPEWPKDYKNDILSRSLAVSIEKADKLSIKKL